MIIKLATKNIHFGYHSSEVLKDVSIEINDGKIASIVGPNGSGKSTLIKCIDHILIPGKGEISVDRINISDLSQMELARHIAYVPQSSLCVFPNTVFDAVIMGRRPDLGWTGSERDEAVVWNVLGLLGLESLALFPFNELSGGQQQKVLIARALAQETGVILLDEPTSNLDIWHQIDVMEIIHSLVKKQNITAIIAIHDLNMAARYSDTVIMMKHGEIVATGKPESVLNEENLASVYSIEAKIRCSGDIPHIIPLKKVAKIDNLNRIPLTLY